ncbi:MAG: hypothetical protein K6C36_05295, partial [Clostridia bacterium]|nr:hypothetical protein [Clostridia bacterium]
MGTNVKTYAKNRKRILRAMLVAAVVVGMALAASPLLGIQPARAATYNASSVDNLDMYCGYDNAVINLTANIQMDFGSKYKTGGIHVTGQNVTLNLNGKIIHTTNEGEVWWDDGNKREYAYGSCITVESGASLTVNAGTSPDTAGISGVDRSKNAIYVYGSAGKKVNEQWRTIGAGYVGIRNFGTVTVNSGVTVHA